MLYYDYLNNGIKYIIDHNNSYSSVTIIILFKVGSRNEFNKYDGISHFIEHMMFKGTQRRPKSQQIVNELYRYGARINAFTDRDNTGYYVKIIPKHLETALDILSDMLFNSKLNQDDIKTEKKVVLNELERSNSEPDKQIDQMICQLLYKNTLLEHDIGGNEKNIKNYNHQMILSYLYEHYQNSNMLISIAGKVDNNIVNKLNKYFGNKKFKYKPQKNLLYNNKTIFYPDFANLQNGIRFNNIIRTDVQQAYVALGVPSYGMNDDRSFIVDIIGTLLAGNMGSRLFIKLREKLGLVYTVKKDIDKFEDLGSLKIIFSTFNGQDCIKKCYKIVIKEFEKLKRNGIKQKELDHTRDYIIGTMLLSKDNTKNVALFLGYNQLFMGKPYTYEYYIKKYNSIKCEDVQRIANEIFKINKINLSIISNCNLF